MYKNNNGNHNGRNAINWYNSRGTTSQKLDNIPHITTIVNGTKRYYSQLDGELYFGDIFVDEVTNIAINMQQQILPIFGYNSYTFDDIAVGSRLVQGQFTVNFTKKNFLGSLQNNEKFKKIARKSFGKDEPNSSVYSDYREKLHLPKWDKGFDIVIGLGGNKTQQDNLYSTFFVIGCVQVSSYSIQLDMTGKPLTETYTFIGRDMKDTLSDSVEQDPTVKASDYKDKSGGTLSSGVARDLKLTGIVDLSDNEKKIRITASDKVAFNSGTLQFVDSFSDKILQEQLTLEPDNNDTELICCPSQNFISAFKKNCNGIQSLVGHVSYKYKSGTDKDSVKDASSNIVFAIKKY